MKAILLATVFAIALHGHAIADDEDPFSGPQVGATVRYMQRLLFAHEAKELKARYSLPRRIAEYAEWTDVVFESNRLRCESRKALRRHDLCLHMDNRSNEARTILENVGGCGKGRV